MEPRLNHRSQVARHAITAVVAVIGAACASRAIEAPPARPSDRRPLSPPTEDVSAELGPLTVSGTVFTLPAVGLDLSAPLALAAAVATIATRLPTRAQHHAFTYQLSKAYGRAGRPDDAAAAIDRAIDLAVDTVGPAELARHRREQADYAWQANRVEDLAPPLAAASAALDACAACPLRDREALGDYIVQRAAEVHSIHALTGDPRYRRAATALDTLLATLPPRADVAQVAERAADRPRPPPPPNATGYAAALVVPVSARLQEARACYQQVLSDDPVVAGSITLQLEIDQAGVVQGATTDPPGGDAGLAAVAHCLEARARTWSLPSRPRPGVARLAVSFVLTVAE